MSSHAACVNSSRRGVMCETNVKHDRSFTQTCTQAQDLLHNRAHFPVGRATKKFKERETELAGVFAWLLTAVHHGEETAPVSS